MLKLANALVDVLAMVAIFTSIATLLILAAGYYIKTHMKPRN